MAAALETELDAYSIDKDVDILPDDEDANTLADIFSNSIKDDVSGKNKNYIKSERPGQKSQVKQTTKVSTLSGRQGEKGRSVQRTVKVQEDSDEGPLETFTKTQGEIEKDDDDDDDSGDHDDGDDGNNNDDGDDGNNGKDSDGDHHNRLEYNGINFNGTDDELFVVRRKRDSTGGVPDQMRQTKRFAAHGNVDPPNPDHLIRPREKRGSQDDKDADNVKQILWTTTIESRLVERGELYSQFLSCLQKS